MLDIELCGMDADAAYDFSKLNATRKKIEQYVSAGILFPEEIRNAEKFLRILKKMHGSHARLTETESKMTASSIAE